MRYRRNTISLMLGMLAAIPSARAADGPRMLCYYVTPNGYLNDHAERIAEIYDGFFFPVGTWEDAVGRFTGVEDRKPTRQDWLDGASKNLASLRRAGVTENFLTVSFNADAEWPSPRTLLSAAYGHQMAEQFGVIGRVAKKLGFRGVCIDVEYPFPRYDVDHEIYTYDQYTVDDLVIAAEKQGRSAMGALLDAYTDAVILVLPGSLRLPPLGQAYVAGLLARMAERDAPGGFHLATEYTYCLHDPVTALATSRFEDAGIALVVNAKAADYWRRRGTMAPGVWPLHMIETGGADYPVQAWKKEMAELAEQLTLLRSVAKRYVWSYTGKPIWYLHTPEIERKYGLAKQDLKRDDIDLRDWHRLLRSKAVLKDSVFKPMVDRVRAYDRGEIDAERLCDAFGTPGRWWILGMLGNPHTQPEFAAVDAWQRPIEPRDVHHGRDGAVRWFAFDNFDPRGVTSPRHIFDYRNTENASAHFVTFVRCPEARSAYLHVGWDDGIIIRLGDKTVFDQRTYPERGKGMLYRDKSQFERRIPIDLQAGYTRLAVASLNAKGNWVFALRITNDADVPFGDVRFRLTR